MALPVFVQDAHGVPHMPTAPASARKLLRQGRARHIPHHAFTLISLLDPVTSPARRSLRLDIAYYGPTAILQLILEGMRMPTLLLTVLVVPPPRSWLLRGARQRDSGRAGRSGHFMRLVRYSRSGGRLLPGHLVSRVLSMHHLADVVGALRALAPISQLNVTSPLPAPLSDHIQHQITTHPAFAGLRMASSAAAASPHHHSALPSDSAVMSLSTPPIVIACCSAALGAPRDRIRPASFQLRPARTPMVAVTATGTMAVVVQQRPVQQLLLAIPHLVAGMDVVWRRQLVQRSEVRVRTADRVVFLLTREQRVEDDTEE